MSANEQKSLWREGGILFVGEILYLKKISSFEHRNSA